MLITKESKIKDLTLCLVYLLQFDGH